MSVHTLDIDSGERDPIAYPNPGDYVVELKNPIYNVSKISLVSARIHASQLLINDRNNTFSVNGTTVTLPNENYSGQELAEELTTQFQAASVPISTVTYDKSKNDLSFTGNSPFTFEFYGGENGFSTGTDGFTTPHDILGLPASNVVSISEKDTITQDYTNLTNVPGSSRQPGTWRTYTFGSITLPNDWTMNGFKLTATVNGALDGIPTAEYVTLKMKKQGIAAGTQPSVGMTFNPQNQTSGITSGGGKVYYTNVTQSRTIVSNGSFSAGDVVDFQMTIYVTYWDTMSVNFAIEYCPLTGCDMLTTGSINLQGPDALILKISSGAEELNKTVYSDTPFYTGRILMCGDVINYSGIDDTVEHNFESGSQNISKIRIQFFYSSNNRLIPYDFRNANHVLKLSINGVTDKLSRVPMVKKGTELQNEERTEGYRLPPNIQGKVDDLNKWNGFIYIFLIVLTGCFFMVFTKPRRLSE